MEHCMQGAPEGSISTLNPLTVQGAAHLRSGRPARSRAAAASSPGHILVFLQGLRVAEVNMVRGGAEGSPKPETPNPQTVNPKPEPFLRKRVILVEAEGSRSQSSCAGVEEFCAIQKPAAVQETRVQETGIQETRRWGGWGQGSITFMSIKPAFSLPNPRLPVSRIPFFQFSHPRVCSFPPLTGF